MKTLRISAQQELPLDAVTQTFAILGVRGTGKTNTGVVLAEELLSAGQQVVILDPVDVWWGLKSGKSSGPGFPIPVIGGEHGDIPLEAKSGELIADFVVDQRASVIISVRHLSMNEQRRFATDFGKRLYDRKGPAEMRDPMMLIVDEADEFAPQRVPHGAEAMLGAYDRLVRRGRSSGIGVTLISQRPQVMNKDLLTQMEVLVAHRVIHKLDRKALEEWVAAHDAQGHGPEFLRTLSTLNRGEAWLWSPYFLDVFKRIQIRARQTFDSSATPKAGEERAVPRAIAKVDLDTLRAAMRDSLEAADEKDPKILHARIRALEAQLAATKPQPEVIEVEVPVIHKEDLDRMESMQEELHQAHNLMRDTIRIALEKFSKREAVAPPVGIVRQRASKEAEPVRNGNGSLPVGEAAILTACAQHRAGCTREQLSILTGYKRSSRDTYVQRLVGKGFLSTSGTAVSATPQGIASLGPHFKPLPVGAELRRYWVERLPEGERAILVPLIEAYPNCVDRDALSSVTGYKRSSRDTYLQRLSARKLVVTERGGAVTAARELF